MNENNSIEAIDKSILTEQTKFRLNEIIGIENYFYQEINQRKSYSKKLGKYVTAFEYIDKIFHYFKRNKWWSINYFIYKYHWSTSWNCKRKFYFDFSYNNRNNEKITKYNKNEKGKA